jgi:hypothetical protein
MLEIKIILLAGFNAISDFPAALTEFKKKNIFKKKI